jgi:hypothetical protein
MCSTNGAHGNGTVSLQGTCSIVTEKLNLVSIKVLVSTGKHLLYL